jgi:hypothetical protein
MQKHPRLNQLFLEKVSLWHREDLFKFMACSCLERSFLKSEPFFEGDEMQDSKPPILPKSFFTLPN